MLITLEGVDGAGKDTVALAYKERLIAEGHDPNLITILNEPSFDRLGEVVRDLILTDRNDFDPITQLHLMLAARTDNIIKTIVPLVIDHGHIVICTRSSLSSIVYQCTRVTNIDPKELVSTVQDVEALISTMGVVEHKILLTCDLDVSITRIKARGSLDIMEDVNIDVIRSRHQVYEDIAPTHGFKIISNNSNLERTLDKIERIVKHG